MEFGLCGVLAIAIRIEQGDGAIAILIEQGEDLLDPVG